MLTLRDHFGADITDQRFTFAETVVLSNVEPKHLRNYAEPGRAVVNITERGEDGRWLFDLRTVMLLSVIVSLTRFVGLKPAAAAAAAETIASHARDEVLRLWMWNHEAGDPHPSADVLLTFEDRAVQAFVEPAAEDDDWGLKDLQTGEEWSQIEPDDPFPEIVYVPHVRLPMDTIVNAIINKYDRLASAAALVR